MKEAKVPKELRFRLYKQIETRERSVSEICQTLGISRKCYYKWYFRDVGHKGFRREYEPKKRHPGLKLTREVQNFIYEQKTKFNLGPERMRLKVKQELDLDISTTIIYRFFQRKKLIRKPMRRLPWYEPMKRKLVVNQPGEGVQVDVKYVYNKSCRRYQFSVFDPYTSLYHFTVFATKESKNAALALEYASKYFGFTILSVQTDNGSEFRGEFHKYLTNHQIPHFFIPKKSPWWNAKVERVHRTIDEEFYQNPYRIWKKPEEWLEYYNKERVHLALGGLAPRKYLESVTLEC